MKLVDIIVYSIAQSEMPVNALFSVDHNQNYSEYMFEHSHLAGKA
jgi:hypothetical protein